MKIDLGRENDNTKCCSPVSTTDKAETIWYPCFYIGQPWDDRKDMPELGELKGGQELPATVRVKSVTRNETKDGTVKFSYDFEVVSIDVPGKAAKAKPTTLKDDEDAIDKGIDEEVEDT